MIVHAVAAQTGRDPIELRPLGEVIDTDALEALFHGAAASGSAATLTLEYEGFRVRVEPEVVTVEEPLEA